MRRVVRGRLLRFGETLTVREICNFSSWAQALSAERSQCAAPLRLPGSRPSSSVLRRHSTQGPHWHTAPHSRGRDRAPSRDTAHGAHGRFVTLERGGLSRSRRTRTLRDAGAWRALTFFTAHTDAT
eukprot:6363057-Prymnesium_polylepis.2